MYKCENISLLRDINSKSNLWGDQNNANRGMIVFDIVNMHCFNP